MARGPAVGRTASEQDDADDGQGKTVKRREGSIVKIKMKDFITYDSVECSPGESLNVVIGPNGTGKSTILCAIVLGLGGKPVHVGKPNAQVQEFIKNNRQVAEISIELYREKRNTIIKRTIYKDGRNTWELNGRSVKLRDVEAETKSLNIQIDNLCQVLAQDRVQDFAKLDKQQLLEATQKAVGKEGMADVHSKLKDLQRLEKQLGTQIETAKKQKEIEQGKVDRLKGDVDKVEKRRGIEDEANASRLKLQCITYKTKKDEVDRYKVLKRQAEEKKNVIEAQIKPFKDKIKAAEAKYNTIKNKHSGIGRRIQNQASKVSEFRSQLESLRGEILEIEIDLERKLKSVDGQRQQEDALRQSISKFRNDIEEMQRMSSENARVQSRQFEEEIANLADTTRKKEASRLQVGYEIEELQGKVNELMRDISRLENQKEQRMRKLHEANRDAYQAARWVDENRHRFEQPVFLPMIVELDVNPKYARYAENAINYQDMIAILCESEEDMKIVIDNCRTRMKLRVNVLKADANCTPASPQMTRDDLKRRFPQFEGYLIDFVKGPNTLLNFLCQRKKFHNIPVSCGDVDASDIFQLYYAGEYKKGFRRSKYRSDLIYFSDPIDKSRFFTSLGGDVDGERLKASVERYKSTIETRQVESRNMKDEINGMNKRRDEIRAQLQSLKQMQQNMKTRMFQLSQKEKDLERLERGRVNPDSVKAEFAAKARTAVLKLAEAHEPFYQALKQLDAYLIESNVLDFDVQAAKDAVMRTKELCKAEEEAFDNAEGVFKVDLKRLERELRDVNDNFLSFQRELDGITNRLNEIRTEAANQATSISRKYGKNVTALWNDNQALFSTLPHTIEELENHIEDKTAHAELLGGDNDADILRRFQEHVRQLESLEQTITQKENEASNLVTEMNNRQNQWKRELNDLVDQINYNFSRYFREMKCAGSVELFTGNNEHDYDNYGLRVRVKFRDTEDLQDLNAHTQSGGERAVSTAIYMLSLQELTPAPFRLVDEINQGMDSNNERRVYELLLRSTSRPGTPQYFLLTPKLLSEMRYNPGTTVLCVMNSACAPDHKKWDMKRFIEMRKKQGSGGDLGIENGAMEVDD